MVVRLDTPHPKQREFLDSQARIRVLLAGRRFGKSSICKNLSITEMLAGRHTAYITPVYQLGKVFYDEIVNRLPDAIVKKANKSDLTITLITGGTLTFFTGEKLDNLRGRKFHLAIIDEAAFIPNLEEGYLQSIYPTLTDYQGKAIIISTPRGRNFFYSLYLKGVNREEGYQSFRFTTYDNPYIKKAEIEYARQSLPSSVFRQEYLAEPSENTACVFNSLDIQNNTITTLSSKPAIAYAADLAKHSDFTCVVGVDEDGVMCHFQRFQKTWEATINEIASLPEHIPIWVDSTGAGDVVLEALQQVCSNVEGFKFTAQSKPQLVMELVKDIEKNQLKFNDVTANELSVFEYKITSTGHIKYEAQSGFHDDTVMALAMVNRLRKQYKRIEGWRLYLA